MFLLALGQPVDTHWRKCNGLPRVLRREIAQGQRQHRPCGMDSNPLVIDICLGHFGLKSLNINVTFLIEYI